MTLPSYLAKVGPDVRKQWFVVKELYSKDGEEVGMFAANRWLQSHITRKATLAQTKNHIQRVTFHIDETTEFLKQTDSGEEYITAVLAGTDQEIFKGLMPEEVQTILSKWMKDINDDPIIGDIDHEEYDRLMEKGLSQAEFETFLKNKPGLARSVQAFLENGKLKIRAIIDKRYKQRITEQAKGVSLEGYITKNDKGRPVDAKLLGFTFGIQSQPAYKGAVLTA